MIAVVIVVLFVLGWVAKVVVGSLISQEARGSLAAYTQQRVRSASKLLPAELEGEYYDTWLAELLTLNDRPLSAVRFATSLVRGARKIAAEAGAPVPLSRTVRVARRAADVGFSSVGILAIAPVLLALAAALRASGHRSALNYRGRLGRNGLFLQYRFTTRPAGPGTRSALGDLVRRTSLDQLPILFNVLRGDMSLIGPPAPAAEFDDPRRLATRPGLASWEYLRLCGMTDLSLTEARERDRRRGFKSDICVLVKSFTLALTDRGRR